MPPYREPTPSPPPPPMPATSSSSNSNMMSSSSSGNEHRAAHAQSGKSGGAGAGGANIEFEIPPNFVPPPPPREVATGVSNLGNTCYMNAALQALAHAPELCHALDAESHLQRCPVALRNERRRRKRQREDAAKAAARQADQAAGKIPYDANNAAQATAGTATGAGGNGSQSKSNKKQASPTKGGKKDKKSHRRSNSGSSNGSDKSSKSKRKKDVNYDPEYEFCTLCEVERLLGRVHSRPEEILEDPQDADNNTTKSDNSAGNNTGNPATSTLSSTTPQEGPVVPEAFVSGFMSKVAPWFRRGVQEDSHEFLRLLIDAMQNSCKGARATDKASGKKNAAKPDGKGGGQDNEYPFRLFSGTVESKVKCSACRSTSCKIDPIEDIGLDVLPIKSSAPASNAYGSSTRGASMSSSRSTSPTSNMALADVTQALERFISSEHLDSGYKCEKCGKLGKATKTSKLASIPPILTLHLKRFRYGSGVGGVSKRGGGHQAGYYNENGGGSGSTRSSRSSRGANLQSDFDNVGPSGSAKIEGHVRFEPVLDVKPYLTSQLQTTLFPKAICRLFAVVVHSGKNSHSGHYVAYVHNVTKKEWWRMDDSKVVRVSWQEVQNAEAYMLFYRVMMHPVGMKLKGMAESKEGKSRKVVAELKRREEAKKAAIKAKEEEEERAKQAEAEAAVKAAMAAVQEKEVVEDKVPKAAPSSDQEDNETPASSPEPSLGKRARPSLANGEEWARAATTLGSEYLPLFSRIQEFITDNVTFSPEFFSYITEEYNRMSRANSGGIGGRVKNNKRAKRIKTLLGKGPGGVHPPEDVAGGAEDMQGGILDLFHQVSIMHKQQQAQNGGSNESFLLPKTLDMGGNEAAVKVVVNDEKVPATTKATPAPEVVPPLTIDNELIIPADNTESYDGAL